MLQVEKNMNISMYLECPVGLTSYFSLFGDKWHRDFEKDNPEEWYETHDQYLKSITYEVFALYEIVKFVPVSVNHWMFNYN